MGDVSTRTEADIAFSAGVSVPASVLVRDLQGESVVLNLDTEMYFGLDEVGTRMWAVLTRSASIESAYDTLLAEYDVEPVRLRSDLQSLVAQLVQHGLLVLHE